MAFAVKMPQLGESVVEGTVSRWLKRPGEAITRLEPLLEISTDKIDTEVPAPAEGTLLEIVVGEGQTVAAGTVLAYIGVAGEMVAKDAPQPVQAPEKKPAARRADVTGRRAVANGEKPAGRNFISPVVARIAAEENIDLEQVSGTGLGGRVTKKDVLAFLAKRQEVPPVSTSAHKEETPIHAASMTDAVAKELSADEVWQPLTTMRRIIADHMVLSKRTSPHVTTVFEVDMTAVVQHREQHRATYAAKGIRLTYTPYFVAAAAHALQVVPEANARFHEDGERSGLIFNRRIHIGVAVALEAGLIVPVIMDADEKNLPGLARAVNELSEQARNGKLPPNATRGGTFTITNHGVGGSLLGTPILNQPQAGILGVGAIVKRPVVRSGSDSLLPSADDAIVIRPICYLSFTFDHRVMDGAKADAFMSVLTKRLEQWPANGS